MKVVLVLLAYLAVPVTAWLPGMFLHPTNQHVVPSGTQLDAQSNHNDERNLNCMSSKTATRRGVMSTTLTIGIAALLSSPPAHAADTKPQEFVNVGTQAPAPNNEPAFVTLDNGVKIKDYRVGSGADSVTPTSTVFLQCSGRLLNLNGVIFYNTKNNNPDGFGAIPLTFTMGRGEALPGLESGIVGMKKGGIRRIIVPAELAYSKYPGLMPQPMNDNDQRALDSVIKNPRRDATILFDVSLERVK